MKQIGIFGGLLALSLAGTYLTWFDDGSSAPREGVVLVDLDPDALREVAWVGPKARVTVTRRDDDDGRWLEVRVTDRETPDADDTDDRDVEPVDGDTTVFVGNGTAQEVWDGLAPLRALRDLRDAAPDALSAYGLDTPESTLTLTHSGGTVSLDLGDETYGTRDLYATHAGRVVLLDDKALRPLEFAKTRMIERRLHPFDEADIATVSVSAPDGRALTLTQEFRTDRARAFWARAGAGTTKDANGGTWLGKVLRLRLHAYPDTDDTVPADLAPVVTVELTDASGTRWPVQILRSAAGGPSAWWAEAGWLRRTVELTPSLAEDVAADLGTLFDPPAADEADGADVEQPAADEAAEADD